MHDMRECRCFGLKSDQRPTLQLRKMRKDPAPCANAKCECITLWQGL